MVWYGGDSQKYKIKSLYDNKTDDDDTSETLSLGSFYILDLFTDSDLQPIMEFPHKDNKKEGAVHILRMPEKDSSGKVPSGRYIAGSDE